MSKNILECSSKGDKRFSALFAKVLVNGKLDTIENHYQTAKVFLDENNKLYGVSNWREIKGNDLYKIRKPVAVKINNCYLPVRFLSQFFDLLWYKYLKTNDLLENVLERYDDYNDIFKGNNSVNCQADVIRRFMQDNNGKKYPKAKRGIELYNSCRELINFLNKKVSFIIEEDDIFNGYAHIVGHQVNAQGKMNSGIAKTVRKDYEKAYLEYMSLFETKTSDLSKMGKCQIVKCENKIIANLFGQRFYGRDKSVVYTDYDKLKEALISLKNYSKNNGYIVSLPYNIGCGLANGDWDNKVLPMINEVFSDYYVLLYKK